LGGQTKNINKYYTK